MGSQRLCSRALFLSDGIFRRDNRARGHELAYHYDDHPELDSKLWILQNHGLVQEITYNNVDRYVITEELASYLTGHVRSQVS